MKNNKLHFLYNEKGFTLVEVLISIIIVSIIMVTLVSIYLTAYRGYDRGKTVNLIQDEGNRMLDIMIRTIHAGVKAESVAPNELKVELDTDSLEYQENGMCKHVTFRHEAPIGTTNGYLNQIYEDCLDIPGATYSNIISNQGATTAVNVAQFTNDVSSNASQKTYLVSIDFVLRRSLGETDRGTYDVDVPFNTKIATRGYIN